MTGSWGYPAAQGDTVEVVVPAELLGAVTDLITDPDAFMAAIVASTHRLVPVIPPEDFLRDAVWLDPAEVVAVQKTDGGSCDVTLRGGAQLTIHLGPLALFEKLKETHE